ncbi:MAB_1171c family putative transporter [Streptomyces rhizosphaericus]
MPHLHDGCRRHGERALPGRRQPRDPGDAPVGGRLLRQRPDHPAALGGRRRGVGAQGPVLADHGNHPQRAPYGALPDRRRPGRPAEDFNTGSGQPLVLTYLLVFMVSQAVPCVTILRQCGPYARMASKTSLRQALRLLSVAAVILFLYCLARVVNVLTAACGLDIGAWTLAASVFSALGIVTLSLALTISSWGPSATRLLEWARGYRSYRALYPLWRDLYESSPDIVLEPPGAAVSDLNYRLHRRVIEIRDGWRELRPYIDRTTNGDGGAGPRGSEESRQAFAEAAQIKQALHAKRTGTIPEDNADTGDFGDRDTDNFTAEVVWLTKVASAYRRLGKAR